MFICLLFSLTPVESQSGPVIIKGHNKDANDRPEGGLKVIVPGKDDPPIKLPPIGEEGDNLPPPVGIMPPPGPPPPEPSINPPPEADEFDEPPTFFGEIVGKQFLIVIDASGSMGVHDSDQSPMEDENGDVMSNASRWDRVRIEAIKLIRKLNKTIKFDLIIYPGYKGSGGNKFHKAWCGLLMDANETNKHNAIDWLNNQYAHDGTPIGTCLRWVHERYSHYDLDKMFVLCDGTVPESVIIEFPPLFVDFKTCEFIGVFCGDPRYMLGLQNLTTAVGGKFRVVK